MATITVPDEIIDAIAQRVVDKLTKDGKVTVNQPVINITPGNAPSAPWRWPGQIWC